MKLKYVLPGLALVCILTLAASWSIANSASRAPERAEHTFAATTPPFLKVGQTYWVYHTFSPALGKQEITVLELGPDGWVKVKTTDAGLFGLEAVDGLWLNTNTLLAIRDPLTSSVSPATGSTTTTTPTAATSSVDTIPGTVLEVGDTWKQGGLELTLKDADISTSEVWEGPGIILHFSLANRRPQEALIQLRNDNFSAVDEQGNSYDVIYANNNANFYGDIDQSFVLESGANVPLPVPRNSIDMIFVQANIVDLPINEIRLTVDGISTISDAQWRVPIPR